MKDSRLIINENNLKAFGRVTDLSYDTISKLYTNNGADSKKKRKSSLPPQNFTTLMGAGSEETKSNEDAYESPTTKKSTRNRRTKQSHSMCITELQEENRQ